MSTNLDQWITDQRALIIRKIDKEMFDEVTGCLKSGYLRSAYIMAWIAIVECMKRKIVDYANLGDKNAEEAVITITKYEEDHRSADTLIYESAHKCGLIDDSEFPTIEYFWKKRCLFAHPYENEPDFEETKHIISQGIKIVIGKELNFNKSYLEKLCDNIVENHFFLSNEIEDIREAAKRYLARTPIKLFPFFFKTLLARIGGLPLDGTATKTLTKLRYFIIELFIVTDIPLEQSIWGLEKRVTDFPFTSFIGLVHSDTWSKIPERFKAMLIAYFEEETDSQKSYMMRAILVHMIKSEKLQGDYLIRYYAYLDTKLSFNRAIHYYGNDLKFFERIKSEITIPNYDIQNEVIDFIKTEKALEIINNLEENQQIELGRLIDSAARKNHYKSKNIIPLIINGYYPHSDFMKAGIAIGQLFTTRNEPFLTEENLYSSLEILNNLIPKAQNSSYRILLAYYRNEEVNDTSKHFFSEQAFKTMIKKVKGQIQWSEYHEHHFDTLTKAILQYYA